MRLVHFRAGDWPGCFCRDKVFSFLLYSFARPSLSCCPPRYLEILGSPSSLEAVAPPDLHLLYLSFVSIHLIWSRDNRHDEPVDASPRFLRRWPALSNRRSIILQAKINTSKTAQHLEKFISLLILHPHRLTKSTLSQNPDTDPSKRLSFAYLATISTRGILLANVAT